jgi:autoinducer 2 (AI-2) kinase
MAIDAGTGSIRAVIFDIDGSQISFSNQEWVHKEETDVAGSMNFDFKSNWDLTVTCIKDALQKANLSGEDILCVSASSMREGIVLYDKNNKEIWAVANVDARASKEVSYINKTYPKLEEKFYKKSGQTFALGAIPRVMWLKNNRPEIYKKVAKISMISDWILYKLSGVIASDPSNAGTTGVFNLKKRDWQTKMAKKLNLKDDIFPPILESGTLMGNVTKEASKYTTLSENTKVVMGGGDVQIGSAGLGVVEQNQVAILGGSFWQQIVNIKSTTNPPKDMSIRVNPHVVDTLSQAEAISFFSGLVMRWFRDAFCKEELKEAKKKNIDAYKILENMAKNVPVGSHGIMPIFSDTMNYKKWYHASPSFLNLSIDPNVCNKASMFRALQENACIISALNLEKIKKFTDIEIDTIIFAGGASKGDLWCQILADTTNCKIKIPKVTEATALGTAIVAGVGAGVYADIKSTAKKLVVWQKEYLPNKQNVQKYNSIKKRWQKAYKQQLKLVDKNITTSMWMAPGL